MPMIRISTFACTLVLGTMGHALALEAGSTMAEWNAASAADRSALLDAMGPSLSPSFEADRREIMACLDRAGQSDAHADLPIGEVAKACADAAEPDKDRNSASDV